MMNGIDVSKWQGSVNWDKVKASGVDFVIIRAGIGKTVDPKFEANYKGATTAGLNVGAYWYSYALSEAAARDEAAAFIRTISGKRFEMPVYMDVEEKNQLAKSAGFVSALITAFCTEMEKAGYFAGFYMSRSPLQTRTTEEVRKRFCIWVAEYNKRLNYTGTVGIWQKSDTGKVSGISGNVDLDECYIDYPKIIKNGGFNGFSNDQGEQDTTSGNLDQGAPATDQDAKKEVIYTVVKGDTLTKIAKKYKTTVKKLVELNGIKDPDKIYGGQKIKIP